MVSRDTSTNKPYRSTVKRKTMIYIFFNDRVQPATCVHRCSTIEEAKEWISEQLKGYTMVDDNHPFNDDVIASSRTAKYMVFDGRPITIDEDGVPCLTDLFSFQTIFIRFYTE